MGVMNLSKLRAIGLTGTKRESGNKYAPEFQAKIARPCTCNGFGDSIVKQLFITCDSCMTWTGKTHKIFMKVWLSRVCRVTNF